MCVAVGLLPLGHRAKGADVGVPELPASFVQPVLELDRIVEMKSVEQGTRVALNDPVGVARGDRQAKLVQVAPQPAWIDQQGVRRRYYENTEDAIVMWCHDLATPEYAARLEELACGR